MPGRYLLSLSYRYLWEYRGLRIWVGLTTALIVGFGAIASLVYLGEFETPGFYIAKAVLTCGAPFFFGMMLGTLLSIRRATAQAWHETILDSTAEIANIADWVTKMLFGAILVSIPLAPEIFETLGRFVAIGPENSGVGRSIGLAATAYFVLCGFFYGFERAYVRLLERNNRSSRLESGLQLATMLPLDRRQWKALTEEQAKDIDVVLDTPIEALRTTDELRGWAKIQAAMGRPTVAVKAYERLLRKKDDDQLEAELHHFKQAEEQAANDARDGNGTPQEVETYAQTILKIAQALYAPAPKGFKKAIALGEPLAISIQNATLQTHLACAYSQQYRWLADNGRGEAHEVSAARDRALFCVRQALDLDSSLRPHIRSLWNPSSPGDDAHLAVFFDDAEFKQLLDPAPALTPSAPEATSLAMQLQSVLAGPPSVTYDGALAVWLLDEDGSEITPTSRGHDEKSFNELRFGVRRERQLRLCVQMVPISEEAGRPSFPVSTKGEERLEAEFQLKADSTSLMLSPDSLLFTVPTLEKSKEPDFSFEAPANHGNHEIWLTVSHANKTVQLVQLSLDVK